MDFMATIDSDSLTAPGTGAARAWVAAFAEGWQAPISADTFADHFQPWFDPHIRLIQPQLPTWSATRRSGIARHG
jgi:hypothetical protein